MKLYPQIMHIKWLYFLARPQNLDALSLHGRSSLLKDFHLPFDGLTHISLGLFLIQISSCIFVSTTCECDELFQMQRDNKKFLGADMLWRVTKVSMPTQF
jgi:hypothetical protein